MVTFKYPNGWPVSPFLVDPCNIKMSSNSHFAHRFTQYLDENLPAIIGLLPPQDEKGKWGRLQLILVKGKVVNDHRLLICAGEL